MVAAASRPPRRALDLDLRSRPPPSPSTTSSFLHRLSSLWRAPLHLSSSASPQHILLPPFPFFLSSFPCLSVFFPFSLGHEQEAHNEPRYCCHHDRHRAATVISKFSSRWQTSPLRLVPPPSASPPSCLRTMTAWLPSTRPGPLVSLVWGAPAHGPSVEQAALASGSAGAARRKHLMGA